MDKDVHSKGHNRDDGYVVRSPQATDAMGNALRHVFVAPRDPDDFTSLLARLERVAH